MWGKSTVLAVVEEDTEVEVALLLVRVLPREDGRCCVGGTVVLVVVAVNPVFGRKAVQVDGTINNTVNKEKIMEALPIL